MVYEGVAEVEEAGVFEASPEELFEGGVVNGLKVVVYVELEVGAVGLAEGVGVVDRSVEAFVGAAGVAVVYGLFVELGFKGSAEGVVYDAVAEGGGADEAGFGLVDEEGAEGARAVVSVDELSAQGEAVGFYVRAEGGGFFCEFAAFGGASGGFNEGAEVGDVFKEVSGASHVLCVLGRGGSLRVQGLVRCGR